MRRAVPWTVLALCAGAVALHLVRGPGARDSPGGASRPAAPTGDRPPALAGRGDAPAGPGQEVPGAAAPATPGRPEADSVRVFGTVRLWGLGVPAGSGTVTLEWSREGADGEEVSSESGTIRADGSYEVRLPRGVFRTEAALRPLPAWEGWAAFLAIDVDLPDAWVERDARLDFEVDPGLVVRGEVVAAATGRPVAGATVGTPGRFEPHVGGATDAAGRLLLSGVAPGAARARGALLLEARAEGFDLGRAWVALPQGPSDLVRIALPAGVAVAGRVLARDRVNLRGLCVWVREDLGGGIGLGRRIAILGATEVGEDGTFRFAGLKPSTSATVELASANEWLRGAGLGARAGPLDLTGPRDDVVLEYGEWTRIPVAGRYPDGSRAAGQDLVVAFRDGAGVLRVAAVQGREHRYVVVAPGRRVDVHVYAGRLRPDRSWDSFEGAACLSAPDEPGFVQGEGEDVPLVPRTPAERPAAWAAVPTALLGAPSHACRLYLLTWRDAAGGQPIGGVSIEVESAGGAVSAVLPKDGRWVLGLGLGRHVLEVRAAGREPETLLVDVEELGVEEATLRLRPATR